MDAEVDGAVGAEGGFGVAVVVGVGFEGAEGEEVVFDTAAEVGGEGCGGAVVSGDAEGAGGGAGSWKFGGISVVVEAEHSYLARFALFAFCG